MFDWLKTNRKPDRHSCLREDRSGLTESEKAAEATKDAMRRKEEHALRVGREVKNNAG